MKLIIAGSRTFTDNTRFRQLLGLWILKQAPREIITGGAKGVDSIAAEWANEQDIPVKIFKPIYDEAMWPNKLAPLYRNAQMAEYGDVLVALWDGISGGTANMIANMCLLHKSVFVVKV